MDTSKNFDPLSKESQKELTEISLKYCEPLYLSHLSLNDTHTKEKLNATITYIKYQGTTYGITCGHVLDLQFQDNTLTKVLSIWGENSALDFGSFTEEGYNSNFQSYYGKKKEALDIAIVKLEKNHLKHMYKKGKLAIDLDFWKKPEWNKIRTCVVSGFPTESKKDSITHVSAPLPLIIAEVTTTISEVRDDFTLASRVSQNDFFFSGVSGGPIFHITQETPNKPYGLNLIGIVYEGSPGSSSAWEKRGKESFYSRNDIQFKVYILTPDKFSIWLKELELA